MTVVEFGPSRGPAMTVLVFGPSRGPVMTVVVFGPSRGPVTTVLVFGPSRGPVMTVLVSGTMSYAPNTRRPAFHVPSTPPSSARPSNGVFCALPGSLPASTCHARSG